MDYSELIPGFSTANGAFLINAVDDWRNWNSYIIGLARCLTVRDILLDKEAYPVQPVRPTLANGRARVQPGSDAAAAGDARTEPTPTPGQIGIIQGRMGMGRSHQRRFLDLATDTEAEMYRKLKAGLEPSLEEEKSRVLERYSRLLQRGSIPTTHHSVEKWLGEWGDVLSVCACLEMEDLAGWLGAWDSLTAVKAFEPKYAEERLRKLRKDQSGDVFDEIYGYRRRWESKNRRQQNAILRAVKGQASD